MTSARPRLRVLSHRELGLQHRNWGAGTNVQFTAGRLVKTKLSRKPQPLCVSPALPLAALFRSRTHACIPHCVRAHVSKTPPRCWASSLHALRASELRTFPCAHPPPEAVGEVQCAGRLCCLVFVGCGRREGTPPTTWPKRQNGGLTVLEAEARGPVPELVVPGRRSLPAHRRPPSSCHVLNVVGLAGRGSTHSGVSSP